MVEDGVVFNSQRIVRPFYLQVARDMFMGEALLDREAATGTRHVEAEGRAGARGHYETHKVRPKGWTAAECARWCQGSSRRWPNSL